ncbi:hypothetical protein GA0074696_1007 [Micromonospora purpureochromogenes]|uniref:Uncharacterized protein n=1 Tax=Micromonospora purpureochromogenes TaxID=47872 RepID=A0A1C4VB81_9ACTN|nr:hypothetical protein GA0074696_1007 [Micromonospora purpureochromogenes]
MHLPCVPRRLYCPCVPHLRPPADELEVTIRCQADPGLSVRLHSRHFPDEYGVGFSVEARADGLRAELPGVAVWVWDDAWLPDFIAQLAADHQGWTEERRWQTNHLAVRAVFHSRGHVALTWHLRPWVSRSDTWRASITTWLDAGQQMSRLAADLREFLPKP